MSSLAFYDAAYPPAHPPATDGVCVYVGGDTPHVWTLAEIHAQTARYRLPIFVRSNPPGPGAATDVAHAVAALKVIGAPHGTLVAWDSETSADPAYMRAVYEGLRAAGYVLIDYGSQSSVFGNDNPDGYYWGAEWTGTPHLHSPDAITQYVSFSGYDESLAKSSLPFWDTRPPAPSAPGFNAPTGLHVTPGHTNFEASWQPPAGQHPPEYIVYVWHGPADHAHLVPGYPRHVLGGATHATEGGLDPHTEYLMRVVSSGSGGTLVKPDTFAAATFTTGG